MDKNIQIVKYWGVFDKDYLLDVADTKDEAISLMVNWWFDGVEKVTVEPITEEEYNEFIKECY